MGTSFFTFFSLRPALQASGPLSDRIMGALEGPGKLPLFMSIAALGQAIQAGGGAQPQSKPIRWQPCKRASSRTA